MCVCVREREREIKREIENREKGGRETERWIVSEVEGERDRESVLVVVNALHWLRLT